jgi:Kef-type K+ transport system membrane component KefB
MVSFALAFVAVVGSGDVALVAAIAAVGLVTAAPLLRVLWLIVRWIQERDWRFVGVACALLAVIAVGAGITILGLP